MSRTRVSTADGPGNRLRTPTMPVATHTLALLTTPTAGAVQDDMWVGKLP